MTDQTIIGAFSEETASRLTGVSVGQLQGWDKTGFFQPAFKGRRGEPFARIYSFRDIVSLRVINQLRNIYGCSLQHLREVAEELAGLGNDKWSNQTLYVLKKKVVFDDPRTGKRQEVVSGQRVFEIPLAAEISDTREAIASLNKRGKEVIGQIDRRRNVMNGRPVFRGTRILVSSVQSYIQHGASDEEILDAYPDLDVADIEAARSSMDDAAA